MYVDGILVAVWECARDTLWITGANPTRATASRLNALVGRFSRVHLQHGGLRFSTLDKDYNVKVQRLLYPLNFIAVY